jgi:type VI secretion system secreted protein VgrG
MADQNDPIHRHLHAWEIQEARLVFGNRLDYTKIRVHELAAWTDKLFHFSLKLQGKEVGPNVHNAVTLGNNLYFPIKLPEQAPGVEHGEFYKVAWLIHELTHAWQYQQMGWSYLFKALNVQIRLGTRAYQFGGEEGLRQRGSSGARLLDFNLEQQGDIARDYYERLKRGQDTSAWNRFVADFQERDSGTRAA